LGKDPPTGLKKKGKPLVVWGELGEGVGEFYWEGRGEGEGSGGLGRKSEKKQQLNVEEKKIYQKK